MIGSVPSHPSTILIIDDHEVVRDALKTLMESTGNYTVVGQAASSEMGLAAIEKLRPDFVLLDLNLSSESGMDLLRDIGRRGINTHVVVLSMFDDEQKICQALIAGARGYLVKSASSKEFFEALDRIGKGEVYLPERFRHVQAQVAQARTEKSEEDMLAACDPLNKLSERERQVFSLIAAGEPNRVIAKKLFVSPRTVETHRARLLKKLSLKTTADLIRYAIKNNILPV